MIQHGKDCCCTGCVQDRQMNESLGQPDPVFRAGLRLLEPLFQGQPMFNGTVAGQQEARFNRLIFGLTSLASRDRVERYILFALSQSFGHAQAVSLAFCGRGSDMMAVLAFIGKDADHPDLTIARDAIMNIDHRAVVNYPVKIWLPEGAEVHRASGVVICKTCHKELYAHPKYRYPTDDGSAAVKGCNGVYYHL